MLKTLPYILQIISMPSLHAEGSMYWYREQKVETNETHIIIRKLASTTHIIIRKLASTAWGGMTHNLYEARHSHNIITVLYIDCLTLNSNLSHPPPTHNKKLKGVSGFVCSES